MTYGRAIKFESDSSQVFDIKQSPEIESSKEVRQISTSNHRGNEQVCSSVEQVQLIVRPIYSPFQQK